MSDRFRVASLRELELPRVPSSPRWALVRQKLGISAFGAPPGEPFTPSPWERSAPAFGYFATQEYEKAHAILSETLEEHPDDPGVLFNLACAESLLGRTDDALGHLQQSFAKEDNFRELARTDSDFDAIRDDPQFRELVG